VTRTRLDEILAEKGFVSEREIKEALLRQKAHGGRFGSQLLYHRYVNESQLVEALCTQLNCPGIVISDVEIPQNVVKMVPAKVALARKVMPFEHDPKTCVLKVACVDPTDHGLVNELGFVTKGVSIELYVAAEIALNTAIAKYYLGQDVRLDDNLLLEIPEDATATDTTPGETREDSGDAPKPRPGILIVSDEEYAAGAMQSVLEREGYSVTVAESEETAIALAVEQRFTNVIIKDSLGTNPKGLADRLRKGQPGAKIRLCRDLPSLILGEIPPSSQLLFVKNLELLTGLIESRSGGLTNHGGRVGDYAAKLSRRLGLADADLLAVTSAAYLHNVGASYYGVDDSEDARQVLELTTRLLSALSYPDVITMILASAYTELPKTVGSTLPIEVLGGSILTVVDLFCHATPRADRLSLDRFDAVKKKLRERAGVLFLPEVVEAFIGMVQEAILNVQADPGVSQVMIVCDDAVTRDTLNLRIRNEGFATIAETEVSEVVHLCQRREPDILILATHAKPDETRRLIADLISGGVALSKIPVFVLTDEDSVPRLTALLDQGIEDVLPLGKNPDLLVSKLHRARARLSAIQGPDSERGGVASGAQGRLADMNLIDLLQALGPGLKTARITVKNDCDSGSLTIYLSGGKIIFADFNESRGPEAIYEGLGWGAGSWTVEPVASGGLPEPNVEDSNESILMEGCRRLDERLKSGHLL